MVTTADTYRHFAEECLRWAEETHNEEHRQACLDMAVVWLRLAATGPNGELQASSAAAPNGASYQRASSDLHLYSSSGARIDSRLAEITGR
jgi:hypothetical protein